MKTAKSFIRPYIYKRPSITNICIRIIILLFIQVLALLWTKSYNAVIVIIASFLGALVAYSFDYIFKRESLHSSLYIIVQGGMIGFLLPETYPPVAVFFITFLVLLCTKCIFMNISNMWANMAAITVVIAWFIGKRFFPGFQISNELISVKNPSLFLISEGLFPASKIDSQITFFMNNHFFRYIKVSVPEGYFSMLWDTHSLIPAFRFNILTIISSIILFADDAFDVYIPAIFLSVYGLLVRLFAPMIFGGLFNTGDLLLAGLTSGTLFTATFLIQWFGTVPRTRTGKVFYGTFAGILAFLITGCGTSSVGMVFTVVICNVTNLLIRVLEEKKEWLSLKKMMNTDSDKGDKKNG